MIVLTNITSFVFDFLNCNPNETFYADPNFDASTEHQ